MRFARVPKASLLLLAALLASCAVPSRPELGGSKEKTLLVRPQVADGGLRTLGIVNPKTAADIAVLEIIPYVHVGNDAFWPLSAQTGEATDSEDPASIVKARQEAFAPNQELLIPLTGLRPQTRYRVVARAYDASASLISTADARSYTEIALHDDDRPEVALTVPVALIDTPFGATRTLSFEVTGSPFAFLLATLTRLDGETEVPVPNGSFQLTPDQVGSTVTFTNLEAQTTYRLRVNALDGGFVVLTSVTHDMALTNDDDPRQEALAIHVP